MERKNRCCLHFYYGKRYFLYGGRPGHYKPDTTMRKFVNEFKFNRFGGKHSVDVEKKSKTNLYIDSIQILNSIMDNKISVVVITYNAAEYFLETLESIKNQTYENIELIICDDASSDNTTLLCRDWLRKNHTRFSYSVVLDSKVNQGIPANCNRGIVAAKGEWIKIIAGDDILLPDAIEKYMEFANQYPESEIIHAKVIRMVHKGDKIEYVKSKKLPKTLDHKMTSKAQFDLLKFSSMVRAPSVFIKKILLENLGYFDESIRLCEDWPFWLKLTLHGKKFYFLNKETVFYRIHEKSVYSGSENKFLIAPFYSVEKSIYQKYIRKNINLLERLLFDYHYSLMQFFFKFNDASSKNLIKNVYGVLNLPYRVYAKLIFLKNNK